MKKWIVMVLLAVLCAAAFAKRDELFTKKGAIIKRTRFLMDTLCTIQVPNDLGVARTEAAINKAFDRMAEVDRKFNCTSPESPIYRFNVDRTPITDPEIVAVVKESLEMSRESGGAFDPTVQPLVDLWGFYTTSASSNTHRVPAPVELKKALAKTGWRRIMIKDGAVKAADGEVRLDLGGIAKGYAIGEAEKALKAAGVKSALIIGGGQVQSYGTAGPGQPWKIGLRNPRRDGYIASLGLESDTGISTSGDYERYFEAGGVRYHHLLDPKTGCPARGMMSLTVLTEDPTRADALDTALFVMGPDKALDFVRRHPGIEIIMVDAKGKIVASGGAPVKAPN